MFNFTGWSLFFIFWVLFLKKSEKNRFVAEIPNLNRGKFAEGDIEVAQTASHTHTLHFSEILTLSSERGEKISNLHWLQNFLLSR